MAHAVINGVTFSMSVSEMVEFAATISAQHSTPRGCNKVDTVIQTRPTKTSRPVNSGTVQVQAKCGHMVTRNSARGRKPEQCAACKGEVSDSVESEAIAEYESANSTRPTNSGPRRNSRRRNWQYSDDDAWKDQPMSDKQRERILRNLETREVPKALARRWNTDVTAEPRITAGAASEIWNSLKAMPHKGNQVR